MLESRGSVVSLASRGVEIVWNLGLYWSTLVYDFLVGRDEEVVPFRARQLRNLLCNLGPSFIKAGQVLANRPDIIREDYMNELCILQDDVPPFPNEVKFLELLEEFVEQDVIMCLCVMKFKLWSCFPGCFQDYRGRVRPTS